jgi:hypothetical protein
MIVRTYALLDLDFVNEENWPPRKPKRGVEARKRHLSPAKKP